MLENRSRQYKKLQKLWELIRRRKNTERRNIGLSWIKMRKRFLVYKSGLKKLVLGLKVPLRAYIDFSCWSCYIGSASSVCWLWVRECFLTTKIYPKRRYSIHWSKNFEEAVLSHCVLPMNLLKMWLKAFRSWIGTKHCIFLYLCLPSSIIHNQGNDCAHLGHNL